MELNSHVKNLSTEVSLLRNHVAVLEARLDSNTNATIPKSCHLDTTNEVLSLPTSPSRTTTQAVQIDVTNTTQAVQIEDNNPLSNAQQPTEEETFEPTASSDFRLDGRQRKNIIRGISATKRDDSNGTGNSDFKVKGVDKKILHSVYIGQLHKNTTTKNLRLHLTHIGVSHVSDVQDLKCTIPGQSSFCVTVDSESDKKVIFNELKWPENTRIRDYRPKRRPHAAHNNRQLRSATQTQKPHRAPMNPRGHSKTDRPRYNNYQRRSYDTYATRERNSDYNDSYYNHW